MGIKSLSSKKNPMFTLFAGARKNLRGVALSIGLGLVFWILQFLYQYFAGVPENVPSGIIRSTAFAGATLIGLALLTGPLARFFPSRNYIRHRRTLGVLGFTFGIAHFLAVLGYGFGFNPLLIIAEIDPFLNPLIFGLIAFCLYIPLYLTSTDWATQKLGYRAWKAIHRLVYIAWIVTVAHFILVNPIALVSVPGALLLAVTVLVFIFELAAFIQFSSRKRGIGTVIGIIIVLFAAGLYWLSYQRTGSIFVPIGVALIIAGLVILAVIRRLRRKPAPAVASPVSAPSLAAV